MFDQASEQKPEVIVKINFDARVFECDDGIIKDEWNISDGEVFGLYCYPKNKKIQGQELTEYSYQ